jgi:hypothetical protein
MHIKFFGEFVKIPAVYFGSNRNNETVFVGDYLIGA